MAINIVHCSYVQARSILREISRKSTLLRTDLSQLHYYVIFVGNPRSGTTLVRTLLDAHPNIVIGNEVHTLRLIKAGKSWTTVAGRILENSKRFSKNPVWTGYSYRIPNQAGTQKELISVLGDKRAAGTTKMLLEEPDMLAKLCNWSPVPIRFIHCVRHPYDVITTRSNRNQQQLAYNHQRYFDLERGAAQLFTLLGPEQYKRIYHEELIANPIHVLQDLLHFLAVSAEPGYIQACQSLIYEKPHQSRYEGKWTAPMIAAVEQETLRCEHLSFYLDQGRLVFDKAPLETTRQHLAPTPTA